MKFRFSFAFANPFRTIRDLRAELADARWDIAGLGDQLLFVRARRDYLAHSVSVLGAALTVADQAIDEFVLERETSAQSIDAFMDDREDLKDRVIELTAGAFEALAYVQSVEVALRACGITIEDTASGPAIVLEQAAIISAVQRGVPTGPSTVTVLPVPQLSAPVAA